MKIVDIIESDKVTLSFEVFPPKTSGQYDEVSKAAMEIASLNPDYMSVTYGAGGSTKGYTFKIASDIQKYFDVPTLAHLTCCLATKDSIKEALSQIKENDLHNILALRGDRPKGYEGDPFIDYKYASDLIEDIVKTGDFCIGGACYPEGHVDSLNKSEDIDNLKKKVEAGCSFLTTQMFFDNNIFYNFLYKVRDKGITVPVVPGIMPITRVNQVATAKKLSGCNVPERFTNMVDHFADDNEALEAAGIIYATEQIVDLIANGIKHIHVYSMNKPHIARGIKENLRGIIGK